MKINHNRKLSNFPEYPGQSAFTCSKILIDNYLDALSKYLDLYSSKYEKVLILGDFNACVGEKHMKCFCDNYNLKSLIKQPACYKNLDNPTCVDLMLTNASQSFQSTFFFFFFLYEYRTYKQI